MRSSVYLKLLEGFSSSMMLDVLALFLLLKYACRFLLQYANRCGILLQENMCRYKNTYNAIVIKNNYVVINNS